VLRVLLVEDSADDADLLRFQLEDAGLRFELHRVSDERGLREAVGSFAPTVAMSDLNLPGYSGLDALELLHRLRPGLPLLLVTGDDEAVAPRVPATVLNKSELHRLPALLAGASARGAQGAASA
jgi:CheY-like chemotaxis protein